MDLVLPCPFFELVHMENTFNNTQRDKTSFITPLKISPSVLPADERDGAVA